MEIEIEEGEYDEMFVEETLRDIADMMGYQIQSIYLEPNK